MISRLYLFFSVLMINTFAIAQVKSKCTIDGSKLAITAYNQAKNYSDGASMISALHQIIAIEGPNSTYKDTLSVTYFKMNYYLSCHLVAKELLEKKQKNLLLLELDALSLKQLNANKEAIIAFEKLFELSKNKFHGYQLAELQFSMKRLLEAQMSINVAISCDNINGAQLEFQKDKSNFQNVDLNAAIQNLKGLIAYELKDIVTAKVAFEESLKISPDFELANKNYNSLKLEFDKIGSK